MTDNTPSTESDSPAPSQNRSRQNVQAPSRTTIACDTCRDRKVKCSGENPCQYCRKRELSCVFQVTRKRKLFPLDHVQDLETRDSPYEANRPILVSHGGDDGEHLDNGEREQTREALDISPRHARSFMASVPFGHSEPQAEVYTPQEREINADQTLSSTRNFGAEVRKLLNPRTAHKPPERPAPEPSNFPSISPLCSPQGAPGSVLDVLPSEKEARECLQAVIFYIGQSQHFIDARILSDTIDRLYSLVGLATDTTSLEMIELLLVFAIGRQILRVSMLQELWPGDLLFKAAIARLPSFTDLRTKDTASVKILALAAVYLQNLDLTDDAYYYSSTALRIAICHQMHRQNRQTSLLTSQRAHLNRLWWTVYMQERRLAAASGNPIGISDDAIDIQPPFDAAGFVPSAAISINLNVAKISGQIQSTIYLNKPSSQEAFVMSVRRILGALHEMTCDIPPEHAINFMPAPLRVSRTSASLYLMLYQAMMHAIRPILLYLAKRYRNEDIEDLLANPSLLKYARTCMVAAQRSLLVLMALQKQNIIGVFGFFDLDVLFSSAFVMVLWKMTGLDDDDIATPAIVDACRILEYLEGNGSKVASQRRKDLGRMTERLAVLFPPRSREEGGNKNGNNDGLDNSHAQSCKISAVISDQRTSATQAGAGTEAQHDDSNSNVWWQGDQMLTQPWLGEIDPFTELMGILNNGDCDNTTELYTMYHDQEMRWSGIDIQDWGELERNVAGFQNLPHFGPSG